MAGQHPPAPELPPPFITVPGISNFRSIGGYRTSSQQSTRQNLIFRSADPSKVTPEGLSALRDLGVKLVFDLRSSPEIKRQGPEWAGVEVDSEVFVTVNEGQVGRKAGAGAAGDRKTDDGVIERIWCPVFADQDYGPERIAQRFAKYAEDGVDGFVTAYNDILTSGVTAYRTVLLHLCQRDPAPCVIHCTAGKDRTGVICALLLLLAGVEPDVVASEYALTDTGLRHLKPLFVQRLLLNPVFGGDEAKVENMIDSRREKMGATILMLQREFGGAEGYVRDVLGLTAEQIQALRRNLVVDQVPAYG